MKKYLSALVLAVVALTSGIITGCSKSDSFNIDDAGTVVQTTTGPQQFSINYNLPSGVEIKEFTCYSCFDYNPKDDVFYMDGVKLNTFASKNVPSYDYQGSGFVVPLAKIHSGMLFECKGSCLYMKCKFLLHSSDNQNQTFTCTIKKRKAGYFTLEDKTLTTDINASNDKYFIIKSPQDDEVRIPVN